jgi:Ca-activated chloride channel family protein
MMATFAAAWAEFHFLRPLWLLALLALPPLLMRWRARRDAADPWRQACDPHLLAHLLEPGGGTQAGWPSRLFALGYVIAVLALAGPAFRQMPEALARAESALVIALDLSDRMRASDIKPDRLSRARFKIADLMKARREGQTALIAYAGDAFVVAPLTDDANSLSDLLASLTPETMPVGGQRPDRAIALARRLLRDAGFARGELLIVTDAADARASTAAAAAAADGLRVSVLGVGTAAGAPIALPQGGFLQDRAGQVLLPRLDEPALRDLASAGEGRYAALSIDAADLRALALIDAPVDGGQLRADERTRAEYRDEGPWLLLLLLPVAALAFRRGWLGCVFVVMLFPAPRADAFEWDALWKREDQRAWEALEAEQAAQALALARDPALRGAAAYRAGEFEQAVSALAGVEDADALYNRGNALAKAQRYEEALAAYDQALAKEPAMEDAIANRQAVKDWLEQQKMKEEQSSQGQPDPQSEGEEGESQSQQGQPQEGETPPSDAQSSPEGESQPSDGRSGEDEQAPPDAEAEDSEQAQAEQQFAEQMEQALKEGEEGEPELRGEAVDPREAEKQQAVEQWLRRVPDDPGGLLRRKFALEHQRRQREREDDPQ